jgi:hypothetical protein
MNPLTSLHHSPFEIRSGTADRSCGPSRPVDAHFYQTAVSCLTTAARSYPQDLELPRIPAHGQAPTKSMNYTGRRH